MSIADPGMRPPHGREPRTVRCGRYAVLYERRYRRAASTAPGPRPDGPRVRAAARRPGARPHGADVAGALQPPLSRGVLRDAVLLPHDPAHRAGEGAAAPRRPERDRRVLRGRLHEPRL